MEKRDNSWISGRQSSGSHMPSRLPMDPFRKSSPLALRFTTRIILVYISLRFIMNGVSCYHQHPSSLVQMLLTLIEKVPLQDFRRLSFFHVTTVTTPPHDDCVAGHSAAISAHFAASATFPKAVDMAYASSSCVPRDSDVLIWSIPCFGVRVFY